MNQHQATVGKPTKRSFRQTLLFELRNTLFSLQQGFKHKWMVLISSIVIAVSLSIPAILYIALNNLQQLAGAWDNELSIHVFLKKNVDEQQAEQLRVRLESNPSVDRVDLITASEALVDFANLSRLGEIMQQLKLNPLPHTLHIFPLSPDNEEELKQLVAQASTQPETDQIQFEQYWIRSFSYTLEILDTVTAIILQLLLLGVFVLIAHNVGFLVSRRSDEIRILKLIGATDSFVTRPFIYLGMWLGLIGGLLAMIILMVSTSLVRETVDSLVVVYKSEFVFRALTNTEYLLVLIVPAITGMLAAFFSCRSVIEQNSPDRAMG